MPQQVISWRLLPGAHDFPMPDGGTSIIEAAIVAAGLKYRKFILWSQCPPCFSRPIAAYAIGLNNLMPGDLRQTLLLPFVTRLAGTADTADAETTRMKLIAFRTIRDIVPIGFRSGGLEEHAARCEIVNDFDMAASAADFVTSNTQAFHYVTASLRLAQTARDRAQRSQAAREASNAIAAIKYPGKDRTDPYRCAYAAAAVREADVAVRNACDPSAHTYAATAAADAARNTLHATLDDASRKRIFTICASILDEAIGAGKQPDPIETALVIERMEEMKRRSSQKT
jgi:uncharacterized membrane protein